MLMLRCLSINALRWEIDLKLLFAKAHPFPDSQYSAPSSFLSQLANLLKCLQVYPCMTLPCRGRCLIEGG